MTLPETVLPQPTREPASATILLTSGGGRVELVHALRSAGAELGLKVRIVACDPSPRSSPACLLADASYQVPDPARSGYLKALMDICVVHRVCLIVPTDAPAMLLLSRHHQAFERLGAAIAGSGPGVAAIASDAFSFRQLGQGLAGEPAETEVHDGDGGERLFEILMYFDRSGKLRLAVPCEHMTDDHVDHLVTRHSAPLEILATEFAKRLPDARSLISVKVRVGRDGTTRPESFSAHFWPTFQIARLAGVSIARLLLSEYCLGRAADSVDWLEGVEMFSYPGSLFVVPG